MAEPRWIDALSVDDLPKDDVTNVTVEGRDIGIYTMGDAVFATDNLCTHGNARLCDGFLDGDVIECPLHQGRFNVRDGRPLCDPVTIPLRTYLVKLEGRRVWLRLDCP
jgi:naphthalene 1,2-dioxygenase system ferredoxin subunit